MPARGVGLAVGVAPVAASGSLPTGAALVAFALPLRLAGLLFGGVAAPSASVVGAGASTAGASLSASVGAVSGTRASA